MFRFFFAVAALLPLANTCCAADWDWSRPDGAPSTWRTLRSRIDAQGNFYLMHTSFPPAAPGSSIRRLDPEGQTVWVREFPQTLSVYVSLITLDAAGRPCFSAAATGGFRIRCFEVADGADAFDRVYGPFEDATNAAFRFYPDGGGVVAGAGTCASGNGSCLKVMRLNAAYDVVRTDYQPCGFLDGPVIGADGTVIGYDGLVAIYRVRPDGTGSSLLFDSLQYRYGVVDVQPTESFASLSEPWNSFQPPYVVVGLDANDSVRWSTPIESGGSAERQVLAVGDSVIAYDAYNHAPIAVLDRATGAFRYSFYAPDPGLLELVGQQGPRTLLIAASGSAGQVSVRVFDPSAGRLDAGRTMPTTLTYISTAIVDANGDLRVVTRRDLGLNQPRYYTVHKLSNAWAVFDLLGDGFE